MSKILHIFNFEEKFSKPFFQFLQDNDFDLKQHQLFHYGKYNLDYKKFKMKFTFARYYSVIKHLRLLRDMFKSKQIIVHSLASPWLLLYLYLFPSLTKKVYWVIWGKDLYFYKLLKKKRFYHHIYEYFRKKVLKNIKHVVTYVKGDYELAYKWYETKAKYHECLMYPSNLYKDYCIEKKTKTSTINILIGNSADPSNNHFEILKTLLPYKDLNIKIIAPLSYGNSNYANQVIMKGEKLFSHKFKALSEFICFNDYLALLNSIDIAVFAHNRQQGMGNIISLLGMGKKIYLKSHTSTWQLFQSLSIKIWDFNDFHAINWSDKGVNYKNIEKTKHFFSSKLLKKQIEQLFNE